jgi:protein-ribulosamine 3-kinase
MSPWPDISIQISASINTPFVIEKTSSISGGCINQAYCIGDDKHSFFVKLNKTESLQMFEAEATGLQEIKNSHTLRVPSPVCWGRNDANAWLVLEYIEMDNTTKNGSAALGTGLAEMHQISFEKFGWTRNNTIGSTPQINKFSLDWIQFWRKYRLGYQLQLAKTNGYTGKLLKQGEYLLAELDIFFSGASQVASLLHGDLWSGNYSYDFAGDPVLYDPALYYGDRETDLAMTELFGGFSTNFYAAYNEAYPLDPGYKIRKTLYNLYHILNHLNLFGRSYLRQAEHMIEKLLTEIH